MSTPSTMVGRGAEALRSSIAGDVFFLGGDGYDDARKAFSLSADQRPAVAVLAEGVADVIQAVRWARAHRMRIAPQGTGHGALPLEPLEGAMLLKTSRMKRVDISAATRIARVEAGAQWQDVTVPAAAHGLAALAGSSANVGVAGYTLGGGMGWLARRYGLAANSVTAAELVTPDGAFVRADAEHERDLFWAVRGGGGSVGVVTALEMRLYPVGELFAGALFFGLERSSEVLHAWRRWTDTVPDELTSVGRMLRVPTLPGVPERLRGHDFALIEAAYLGDHVTGAELLGPLRELGPEIDTFAVVPAPALQGLHMDPERPVFGNGDGMFLGDLPAAAVDALVAVAGPHADTLLQTIEVRHLGGALARDAKGAGAQPRIDAKYVLFAAAMVPSPALGDAIGAQVRALEEALSAWDASYDYYNFEDVPAGAEAVLPREAYRRLREIKAVYDPDEAIISAHPVRPAAAELT